MCVFLCVCLCTTHYCGISNEDEEHNKKRDVRSKGFAGRSCFGKSIQLNYSIKQKKSLIKTTRCDHDERREHSHTHTHIKLHHFTVSPARLETTTQ